MALIDLLLKEQEAEIAAKEATNNYNLERKKESPDENELWRLKREAEKKDLEYWSSQRKLNWELAQRLNYYFKDRSSEHVEKIDFGRIYNIARSAARCEVDNHYYTRHY